MSDKLLTIEEVAKYLNLTKGAVEDLVVKGELPAYKVGGSFLRFKKEQVDIYRDRLGSDVMAKKALFRDRGVKSYSPGEMPAGDIWVDNRDARRHADVMPYNFWEKLEDFLYYNDFYIISMILLVLVILAVFEF